MKNNLLKELVSKFDSQKHFCEVSGMDQNQCSHYMTGKKEIKEKTLKMYAKRAGFLIESKLTPIYTLEPNVKK